MPGPDPERLVCLDETWASTDMTRARGRSPGGARPATPAPHGHRRTTTFVAASRAEGPVAPTVVHGAIDGDVFVAYVRQQSVPAPRPGDVAVMDDPARQERAGVREAAGARPEYLPSYSPDCNPIEVASSEPKALLRKAVERPAEGLWRLLGRPLDGFAPQVRRDFILHRGYRATPTGKPL